MFVCAEKKHKNQGGEFYQLIFTFTPDTSCREYAAQAELLQDSKCSAPFISSDMTNRR